MRSSIRLGKLFGIEIGLHYSWFLIALLITMSLGSQFQASHAEWGSTVIWALSVLTAILFFVTLLAHEMSHALVARARGLTTRAITLFALGGVAQIEKEPEDAKTEFLVGIVGPLSSAVIGVVSLGIAWALGWRIGATPATPVARDVRLAGIHQPDAGGVQHDSRLSAGWRANSALYPVADFARRSARHPARRRRRQGDCAAVHRTREFSASSAAPGFGGLWIAFIGWFLLQAATASASSVALTAGLKGVRVSDVMTADCVTLDGNLNVEQFVESYLLRSGKRCFVVRAEWRGGGAGDSARDQGAGTRALALHHALRYHAPLDQLHTVAPTTPVMEALETMGRDDVNQLPVVSGNHLDGIITRANVLQFLQTRAELGR